MAWRWGRLRSGKPRCRRHNHAEIERTAADARCHCGPGKGHRPGRPEGFGEVACDGATSGHAALQSSRGAAETDGPGGDRPGGRQGAPTPVVLRGWRHGATPAGRSGMPSAPPTGCGALCRTKRRIVAGENSFPDSVRPVRSCEPLPPLIPYRRSHTDSSSPPNADENQAPHHHWRPSSPVLCTKGTQKRISPQVGGNSGQGTTR